MDEPRRVRVVTGIIIRAGRVLLTQRKPCGSYPYRWESPGGKVEPSESDEAALERELLEELGVRAKIGAKLAVYDLDPNGAYQVQRPYRVALFDADIGDQCPSPLQAIGIGWFGVDDVRRLQLLPANEAYRHELATRLASEETRPASRAG